MAKKHILIVGGTKGIGRAVTKTFVAEGHTVSIMGRKAPDLTDSQLSGVQYWAFDLLEPELLEDTLTQIIDHSGKLSNLLFFQRFRGEGDDWKGEIETSLTATKNIIEKLRGEFEGEGGNSIVIVTSIAANLIAGEQPLSYHVGKAGLQQMVRFYAVELGSEGIRVNSVSPGTVLKDESKEFYLQNEPLQNLYKTIIPLGRMGTAEEVADVISFLCSAKASYITGQNLVVDGGLSLQWQESLARQVASLQNPNLVPKTQRRQK